MQQGNTRREPQASLNFDFDPKQTNLSFLPSRASFSWGTKSKRDWERSTFSPSVVWSNFHVFLVSLVCYQCSWRLFCPKHPLPPFLMFCPNLQPDALLESDKFLDLCTLWFTSLPIILIVAKSTRKMLSAMLYPDLENKYISPPIIILSASVGCLFLLNIILFFQFLKSVHRGRSLLLITGN